MWLRCFTMICPKGPIFMMFWNCSYMSLRVNCPAGQRSQVSAHTRTAGSPRRWATSVLYIYCPQGSNIHSMTPTVPWVTCSRWWCHVTVSYRVSVCRSAPRCRPVSARSLCQSAPRCRPFLTGRGKLTEVSMAMVILTASYNVAMLCPAHVWKLCVNNVLLLLLLRLDWHQTLVILIWLRVSFHVFYLYWVNMFWCVQ